MAVTGTVTDTRPAAWHRSHTATSTAVCENSQLTAGTVAARHPGQLIRAMVRLPFSPCGARLVLTCIPLLYSMGPPLHSPNVQQSGVSFRELADRGGLGLESVTPFPYLVLGDPFDLYRRVRYRVPLRVGHYQAFLG